MTERQLHEYRLGGGTPDTTASRSAVGESSDATSLNDVRSVVSTPSALVLRRTARADPDKFRGDDGDESADARRE